MVSFNTYTQLIHVSLFLTFKPYSHVTKINDKLQYSGLSNAKIGDVPLAR